MGIFPLPQGFGGTIPMKEWVLPLAGVGAGASILPEGEVFVGLMGDGDGEPEAESSAVTENFVEMMGVEVGPGGQTIPLLLEGALPVRHEVRVLSTKKSPSGAGSGARKQAVRPMRVTWPPQTKRHPHPRRACSPRSLLPPHRQESLLHQPQPDFPLPEVGGSLLLGGCLHAGAEGEGGPPHPCAQAGILQPSLWLPRNLQQALCPVRSL